MQPDPAKSKVKLAVAGLCWLVPAPSLGILAAVLIPGPLGQAGFALSKIWLLALPAIWAFWVQREPFRWPRISSAGLGVGAALGFGMGAVIIGFYLAGGARWIDHDLLAGRVRDLGLDSPTVFLLGAVYWCLVNALLEEYVWRWFVYRGCRVFLSGRTAVLVSALLFTLHHIVALAAMGDPRLLLLGSTGVFLGGVIWSACYRTYGSVWPGYLSHLLADAAIMAIGWRILFG